MRKIVYAISELSAGGAARVLSTLANHFANSPDCEVGVVSHRSYSGYFIDSKVQRHALFEDGEVRKTLINKVWRRLIYFPRLARAVIDMKPDVVVSFMRGMNWRLILVCRLLRIRIIATEHTNHLAERSFFSSIERGFAYRFASSLIVLSRFDQLHYSKYLADVRVIPNPLGLTVVPVPPERQEQIILAMGGMDRWRIKGFDTLLRIFARVSRTRSDWTLRIVGPGDAGREYLSSLSSELGISHLVEFSGFTTDVAREMRRASIFALTSRYEGFSMVLVEAMSQGCCCISFDCQVGPRELLAGGASGVLVEDDNEAAFASALGQLMDSPSARESLAREAIVRANDFAIENIEEPWRRALFGMDVAS